MSGGADSGRAIGEKIASGERILVVVAGPNGAGKTTFVEQSLSPLALRVVNADAIAKALSPQAPEGMGYEAAALAENVRQDLLARDVSFCMETVFSDRAGAKLDFLRQAQARGYHVFLVFVGLQSSDLSMARVLERTQQGGHDVPDGKLLERFPRTFDNLRQALAFVDHAFLFDNSSADEPYRFVAELRSGKLIRRGSFQPRWWTSLR